MRKKFTMLLASLFLFVGTTSAEVTKYYKPDARKAELAAGDKVMFYNTALVLNNEGAISQNRTGFLIDNGSNLALSKQKPTASPIFSEKVGVWTIEAKDGNKVNVKGSNGYVGILGVTNNTEVRDLFFLKWTDVAADKKGNVGSENANGELVKSSDITAGDNLWLIANSEDITTAWNGNEKSFATWSTGHPYAVYSVVEAEAKDLEAYLAAAKESAKASLTDLAKLSISSAAAAITQIDAVTMANNDLEAALNAIDELVLGAKTSINGKNVNFTNCHTDSRGGRFLGYDKNNARVAAVLSNNDDAIWTIKLQEDGSFKLYNIVNKIWMGTPDGKWDEKVTNNEDGSTTTENTNYRTPGLANENEAASYKFEVKGDNQVVLVAGDKVAHTSGNDNYRIMHYWDKNDKASLWTIADAGTIQVSDYNAYAEKKSALMNSLVGYAKKLQDELGLVKSGDNVQVVLNQSGTLGEGDCQPSSNLLDGNTGTYVHSAYSGDDNTENHYIEVVLSEASQNIFCYFSKRTSNNNNRPAIVEVYAGNSADAINTKVATLNMAESCDNSVPSYFSKGLDLGAEYTHLRFVVKKTNSGTKFFTLSEFYVLPVTNATKGIADLAGASITDTDLDAKLVSAENCLKTLQLPETLKEVEIALEAFKNNHAEVPALGQFPTAVYNELKAAYDNCNSIDQLDAVFEAADKFLNSMNVPVFTIDGVISYAANKSIYDNNSGTLYFKETNLLDKTMWWKSMAATEGTYVTTVNTGSYSLVNAVTGKGFWGAEFISVEETDPADTEDDIFMFRTNGEGATVHAQANYSQIVRYEDANAKKPDGGSAWKFTYIGNSYDLDKLTEEHIKAITALKALYNDNLYYKEVVEGDAFGEYTGDRQPVLTALANLKALLDKSLTELAAMDVKDLSLEVEAKKISDAANSFTKNLPVAGKYYQFVSSFKVYTDQMAAYSQDANVAWKKLNNADKSFYWQAVATDKGVVLKNVANGKFLQGNPNRSGVWATGDASANAEIDIKILSTEESEYGYEYALIIGDWEMHTADHNSGVGTAGNVVSWNITEANTASAWYIVEFDELPSNVKVTYNFKYNGVQKYSSTVDAALGEEYPDFAEVVTLPYGVKVKGDKPAGIVDENTADTYNFDLELDLPFEVASSVDEIATWYYAQMHATKNYSFYIQALEDGNIEWSDNAVVEGEADSHMWGFIGDVWAGIKVVNKSSKKAIVSAGDNNDEKATMGDIANATAFIPTASAARPNTDWFCLQSPVANAEGNKLYLNAHDGCVKHWGAADEGSSIFLTEPSMEFDVEVTAAGYATYYTAYRLAIPEDVKVYVVSQVTNDYAVLTEVEGSVLPEYTAVIIEAEAGTYTFEVSVDEAATIASNALLGTLVDTPVRNAYILATTEENGVGFYKAIHDVDVNGGTNAKTNFINHANKAYLPVSAVPAGAPMLRISRGETGIEALGAQPAIEAIYDLTGRRVEKMEKGIYIVNGRKVIVK